jgi:hypothetical protein
MKFLKQKNISKFSITDQTLFANQYGRAVMNLTGAVRLPKGTTAQRPNDSLVRTLGGADGFIRYNIDIDGVTGGPIGVEAYVDGVWEVVRAPGANAITKQTFPAGDGNETLFGPLNRIPASANNVIVLIGNVFQISDTNFILEQNPIGKDPGWYIKFTSPVPELSDLGTPEVVTVLYGYAN